MEHILIYCPLIQCIMSVIDCCLEVMEIGNASDLPDFKLVFF